MAGMDLDVHCRLVVLHGREDLALSRGNHGVARDQLRHDAPHGLDAHRERSHVHQDDVLQGLAAQNASLQARLQEYMTDIHIYITHKIYIYTYMEPECPSCSGPSTLLHVAV